MHWNLMQPLHQQAEESTLSIPAQFLVSGLVLASGLAYASYVTRSFTTC